MSSVKFSPGNIEVESNGELVGVIIYDDKEFVFDVTGSGTLTSSELIEIAAKLDELNRENSNQS